MSVSALILAGSRGGVCPVAAAERVSHKSLVLVEGQPILARVIHALREAGIARIAVSASDDAVVRLAGSLGAEIVPPEDGPAASVAAGFAALGPAMLITTSDHALLQAEWVRDFLENASPGSDVAILLARRPLVEAALPGTRRTWLRLADGHWSGCNLFLLAGERAGSAIAAWQAVEADRKRPWRIAARLGLPTLVSYALGRLTLAETVRLFGRRIGLTAQAIAAHDGLAAVDVDNPADLADVRRILGGGVPTCTSSGCGST